MVQIRHKNREAEGQEEIEKVKERMEKHLFCVRGRFQADSESQEKRKGARVAEGDN